MDNARNAPLVSDGHFAFSSHTLMILICLCGLMNEAVIVQGYSRAQLLQLPPRSTQIVPTLMNRPFVDEEHLISINCLAGMWAEDRSYSAVLVCKSWAGTGESVLFLSNKILDYALSRMSIHVGGGVLPTQYNVLPASLLVFAFLLYIILVSDWGEVN